MIDFSLVHPIAEGYADGRCLQVTSLAAKQHNALKYDLVGNMKKYLVFSSIVLFIVLSANVFNYILIGSAKNKHWRIDMNVTTKNVSGVAYIYNNNIGTKIMDFNYDFVSNKEFSVSVDLKEPHFPSEYLSQYGIKCINFDPLFAPGACQLEYGNHRINLFPNKYAGITPIAINGE